MLLSRPTPGLLGILGTLLFGAHTTLAISLNLGDSGKILVFSDGGVPFSYDPSAVELTDLLRNIDSIKSAASTVAYGMMTLYKGNETGQPVGLLPGPYYWWEAGAMFDIMIQYWFYTGDATYNNVTMEGLLAQVGPDNDYMPPNQTKTEGNDDQVFWAFAAMSAAERNFPDPPATSPSWLSLAQAVFNLQVNRWDTQSCGGGLRWQIFSFNNGYDYKNTISNGGFFQLAARLARYTGNDTYAQWAEKSYDWIIQTPLFTSDYALYDGAQIENNCTIASKYQWTYNIGTYLVGAANMYNYTNGNSIWQTRIEGLLNGSEVFFPSQYGQDIMVEVACEPSVTCNYDQPSFKAYLSAWMAATTQLAPFTYDFIQPKLHSSAQGAAQQCVGGSGSTCGRMWYKNTWDGKQGVGEQMSALSVIQSNLITKVGAPVTSNSGGTSKSNPAAGSQGDNPVQINNPNADTKVTTGDKAGAGNKAPTFTTSPNKKRKLSPPETTERPLINHDISSSPSGAGTDVTASPSVPRFIPPHLVLEGARKGRSPTPEPPNTAGSSPSGAYANLTLEGDGDASGTEASGRSKRRGSIASSSLRGGASTPIRPSSPGKRRASDMGSEDADMAENQKEYPPADEQALNNLPEPATALHQDSKPVGSRHKREASVDMLTQEPSQPQSGTSSTSSMNEGETSATSSVSSTANSEVPPINDQIAQVMQLAQKPLSEGLKGYVVASKWLSRVLARGLDATEADKYGKEAREGDIGPVDNSGINLVVDPSTSGLKDEAGEPFIPLRPGLQMSDDFEVLPQVAWDLIIKWYGLAQGSPVITRYCHNTSTSDVLENLQWELNPPIFTILKLPDMSGGLTQKFLGEREAAPVKVLASRHELYQAFLKRAKMNAGIELKTKVRVWRILGGLGEHSHKAMITPAASRSNSPAPGAVVTVDPGDKLVLDVATFTTLQLGSQRELVDSKDETANEKYNGHSRLDFVGLRQDEVIVLEEQIGGPAGGEWVSDSSAANSKLGVPVSVTKNGTTMVQNSLKPGINSSRSTSPASSGGIMTRGRQAKNNRNRGTVGLNNLGNTCYMNSALQCVRSAEELTRYFLADKHTKELNPSNPLSHNGQVAKSYASLLQEMYGPNCASSFAPRNFKNTIGKYGPSFSGYQQQDSQEFLLFLLDGLQEDLNRVKKKPYIEKPDSTDEMVGDPVALKAMADKCWDIYKKRNDSVITDLFAGMYKSTVVCPVCNKVSIIFDPFNNLTLQLPIETLWSRRITFFPLHGRPIIVSVDIDKNASFFALKGYVAGKFEVDPKKTIAAEFYKHRYYKVFNDSNSISDEHFAEADEIGIWELDDQPTNYPPPKKQQRYRSIYSNTSDDDLPEGDSPLAEKMVVGLFHRRTKMSSLKNQHKEVFGVPSFILLTSEEAKDYDTILRKVLSQSANMTSRNFLREEDLPDSNTEDSDTVLLNDEADSSTDSRIQAKSLESEDGMVDVSMENGQDATMQQPRREDRENLAPMLRPGSFITPGVRHLFEMKCVPSAGNQMIPIGLSQPEDVKNYPTLATRQPEADTSPRHRISASEQIRRRQGKLDSPPTSDEDADDLPPQVQTSTSRQVLDSGSDSDGLPPIAELIQPAPGFGTFSKNTPRGSGGLITYSRKGKQVAQPAHQGRNPTPERPRLLNLGEAIILDWTPEGYDALFSNYDGNESDESRGAPTWDNPRIFSDPELEEKRRIRSSRRRDGVTLGDCLDEFGKPEVLSENDAWYCPRCKEHRRASKTFELWKAPDILVVHLKRFSAQGRFRDKIDVFVDFPTEGLDLSSRLAIQEEGKSPIYDLFAVDNHYGGLGGGHYTAFAKNFFDGEDYWYEYNDSSVFRRSDPSKVVTPAAYLLFYRRRASTPLGGPFFERLFANIENGNSESQPTSRAPSPAGEGKRRDDSSRNGSSDALRGVGAAHQAGGGGSAVEETTVPMRTGIDDDLPAYSAHDPGATTLNPRILHGQTLENMDLDDDEDIIEGIGSFHGPFQQSAYHENRPQWSFGSFGRSEMNPAPPGSEGDGGDEDVFENDSTKVANSSASDNAERRMLDFHEDEGTTTGVFGTPPRGSTPLLEVPPPIEMDDEESPAAEVMLDDPGRMDE